MAAYTLSQLVSHSAQRYPQRPAVVCGDAQLTYAQLEEASNRLGALLRSVGVCRGERVGLYLPKSLEAVVGIVGVLKAGGAYVPFDSTAPPSRIQYLLHDAELRCLITTPQQLGVLRQLDPVTLPYLLVTDPSTQSSASLTSCRARHSVRGRVVPSDASRDDGAPTAESPWPGTVLLTGATLTDQPSITPAEAAIETDPAYILYTSGSTGQPKGVMITHRNSLTFVNWCQDTFQLCPEDRVSSHAPFHFDLSVFDLYVTWAAGACVCLIPEELNVFPMSLAEFIEQRQLSVWYSVPSALTRLLLYGQLDRRDLHALRLILFAGEVFPTKYLRRLARTVPHAALYNLFGPTETNVCTYHRVADLPADDATTISIGRACANTETFVVDDEGRLAGPGEVGELYVRGPSVMKGYWKQPEKTRQVLVRPGFWPGLGDEVSYRTGDLVRLEADGTYQFLGRKDHMVKSRGHRIELGEIEAALYGHAAIKEAAVVAVPDEEIGNRLKAFVTSHQPLTAEEVAGFLVQRLPRYMVPEMIEVVGQLPKTSTGKVDKQRLQRV